MDSTKKVTKKLAGAAARTAAWATNVGNEHGQVLMSVLTAHEGGGLLPMAVGLMRRYREAGVPPPKLLHFCKCRKLPGLARWNEDRAAAAVDQAEQALRCYSGQLQHNLNQLSQQLLNRKLVEDYTKPGEYTGELIGVECLYSQQCQELREDIGRDPDAPDGTPDDESEWEDEGFEEVVGIPSARWSTWIRLASTWIRLPTGRPSSLRRKRQSDSCFWKSLRGPRLLRRSRSQLHQPEAHCTGERRLRRRTKRSCRKQAVRFQLDSPATSVDSQRGLSLAT
ncbi:hypothetical protein MHYP_G00192420 [Metynnis hypsauchen]